MQSARPFRDAWPTRLATTEASLIAAGVQAEAAHQASVARLLRLARVEAQHDLETLDRWFLIWPEWARFEEACALEGWVSRLPVPALLRHRVQVAFRAFGELAAKAERTCSAATASATLGDSLEDLLVEVWRCERAWRLDASQAG